MSLPHKSGDSENWLLQAAMDDEALSAVNFIAKMINVRNRREPNKFSAIDQATESYSQQTHIVDVYCTYSGKQLNHRLKCIKWQLQQ